MVVLVEEEVAAGVVWEEIEDGQTKGLNLLPSTVLCLVFLSSKTAYFESAVEYSAPTIA
jgi:hypothetical protein